MNRADRWTVDADSAETTAAFGSFFFSSAAADAETAEMDSEMTAAFGSFSFLSAAADADSAETDVPTAVKPMENQILC